MKKLNVLFCIYLVMLLIGCSKSSSSQPASDRTPYSLQNYLFDVGLQSNNCIDEGNSIINCDSESIFGGVYSINFKIPNDRPGAYVVMPPSGETYGLTIKPISGCHQAIHSGEDDYMCNFTILANGTAEAGKILHFKIAGDLGEANLVTIKLR